MYSAPTVTTGGTALKYFSSIRVVTKRGEEIYDKSNKPIGMTSKLKCIKNKVGVPFKEREMTVIFGKGYQVENEYLDAFESYGLVNKGAAGWYTLMNGSEAVKLQGGIKVADYLKEHPDLYADYKARLAALMSAAATPTVETVLEGDDADEKAVIAEQTRLEEEALAGARDSTSVGEDFVSAPSSLADEALADE
jgi:recombination protein RecA